MINIILIMQNIAVAILFAVGLYICFQKPSRMQTMLLIVVISTMIMLIGYSIELTAENVQQAMSGVAFSYIGKPFALLATLLFIMNYCGVDMPKKWVAALAVLSTVFPILIFTNDSHFLYYSSVAFDRTQPCSPLILGHGPLYYLYMADVVFNFIFTVYFTSREYRRCETKQARQQVLLLFGMIFSSVAGYVFFLSGITNGYDATMAGATVGTWLMILLFSRYHLFDAVNLAKEQALNNASGGLLVLNGHNMKVYSNAMVENLLQGAFTMEELMELPMGKQVLRRNDQYYEINKTTIINNARAYGTTIEITDVTAQHNYSARLENDVRIRTQKIEKIQRSVISSFAGIVEARDNSTGMHIKRMSQYVQILAFELLSAGDYSEELNMDFIFNLTDVAPLHDIGKMCVPDSILMKPGRLTPEEFDVIKTHTTEGARIVRECLAGVEKPKYVSLAEQVAMYHHEKWNGTGYPCGHSGTDIPLAARIVAVADVYDAVRSERCYKPPFTLDEAADVILSGSGTHFDPLVVEAFKRCRADLESI